MSRGDKRNVLEEIKLTFGDDLNILLVYMCKQLMLSILSWIFICDLMDQWF